MVVVKQKPHLSRAEQRGDCGELGTVEGTRWLHICCEFYSPFWRRPLGLGPWQLNRDACIIGCRRRFHFKANYAHIYQKINVLNMSFRFFVPFSA